MLLTSPIWLFALAAISIPVVIHLWNIRPGKTLKVGSIALFTESSPKSSRSFKLLDILLLILRCAILILLAFLLAAPLWQQHLKASKTKGWLLIPEVNLLQIYKQFQPKIDSLTKAGYEFHFFKSDFKKQDLPELLKTYPDSIALRDTLNYWLLSRQLSGVVPAAIPVELFTTNTISHFKSDKPQTNLRINWHTYTPVDSVSTWIAGAWLTVNGDVRIMQGTATPSATSYQYINIKNGSDATAYHLNIENGIPVIRQKNNVEDEVIADTSTTRIAIYADKNTIDANYLRAALDAISQLTQHKTIIKQYSQPGAIPGGQSWLFWLSDKSIDQIIVQKSKNVFQYEAGKVTELNSWMVNNGDYAVMQGQAKIPLYKTITTSTIGDAVWTDGFGNAILSLDVNTYHFYTRFNPAWNDLVWNDNFPKWLLSLTDQQHYPIGNHDRRAISAEQLQPVFVDNADHISGVQTHTIELANYLWMALALVFIIERWLATKNKPILSNG